jgi:membrane protease YdiL (CAAX protease family)
MSLPAEEIPDPAPQKLKFLVNLFFPLLVTVGFAIVVAVVVVAIAALFEAVTKGSLSGFAGTQGIHAVLSSRVFIDTMGIAVYAVLFFLTARSLSIRGERVSNFFSREVPVRGLFLAAALGLALAILAFSTIVAFILWGWGTPRTSNNLILFPRDPSMNWIQWVLHSASVIVVVVAVAPLTEEFYFRGVLLKWLRQSQPVWLAILINSLVFGALHFEFVGQTLALGLAVTGVLVLLGTGSSLLFLRFRSLWPGVILHGAYNFTLLAVSGIAELSHQ